jgi:hypothetical protein
MKIREEISEIDGRRKSMKQKAGSSGKNQQI